MDNSWPIGTKVRIKEDLRPNELYGGTGCAEEMLKYCGKEAVIVGYEKEFDCPNAYLLDIDESFWSWNEEMLVRITPSRVMDKVKEDILACSSGIEMTGYLNGIDVAALIFCKKYHPEEVCVINGNKHQVSVSGMTLYLESEIVEQQEQSDE